jgi:uncharacterized protein (TIGR03067 family)
VPRSAALVLSAAALLAGGCKQRQPDAARVQGEWAVVAVEAAPDADPVYAETAKELTVTLAGEWVTLDHPKGRSRATFSLEPAKEPKEVDVGDMGLAALGASPDPIQEATRGIYKFEGAELVVAVPVGPGKDFARPTEFKPSADRQTRRAVLVLHLRKK